VDSKKEKKKTIKLKPVVRRRLLQAEVALSKALREMDLG
tara:strand:+ start:67 stop:183 length:117 start_codon:yes stop_codon:yes gene_type:complete